MNFSYSAVTLVTEEKTVTPSATEQEITPTAGKVISKVTVAGDADLDAANIKKGVVVFGVTGTHSGVVYDDATGQDPLALSSSVPANEATGVAVDASIVLTFNNQIASEEIIIIDMLSGNIISTSKDFDVTGKILTITHALDFELSQYYSVYLVGVKDIYGQSLTPALVWFAAIDA